MKSGLIYSDEENPNSHLNQDQNALIFKGQTNCLAPDLAGRQEFLFAKIVKGFLPYESAA